MRTVADLRRQLASIDRRGYPALKSLAGVWDMGAFELSIDHVQGDPFAAPSNVSVWVPRDTFAFPPELWDGVARRTALEDLLVRRFAAAARQVSFKVGGSGKSGLIATSEPGPEVLERSACEVGDDGCVLRFEMGFPAHGRTVDARALERMLTAFVPRCVEQALVADAEALRQATRAIELADDQEAIRRALVERDLVAFVADGAVLPRASGVSSRPLAGARPFRSPGSLRVVLDLPHRGRVSGMGIPRGITLIVGGGYHGKSTLLKALQEGVYNHVAGDGRELVIADEHAMKLRAEDGRAVAGVDISPFIDNLPDGRDTHRFSTVDASGSTSQAASTVEALEAGCRTLLIDEDTSATNFMVRDALMEAVVAADREPITPFVERVRGMWERNGVSSVIVVGSSGAFFPVADLIIQMDSYEAFDITERVRAVCRERGVVAPAAQTVAVPGPASDVRRPRLSLPSPGASSHGRGRGGRPERIKVRTDGLDGFSVGRGSVDLRQVEQVVDREQVAALAQMVRSIVERGLLDGTRTVGEAVDVVFEEVRERGLAVLDAQGTGAAGLAMPRPEELVCSINRWRA